MGSQPGRTLAGPLAVRPHRLLTSKGESRWGSWRDALRLPPFIFRSEKRRAVRCAFLLFDLYVQGFGSPHGHSLRRLEDVLYDPPSPTVALAGRDCGGLVRLPLRRFLHGHYCLAEGYSCVPRVGAPMARRDYGVARPKLDTPGGGAAPCLHRRRRSGDTPMFYYCPMQWKDMCSERTCVRWNVRLPWCLRSHSDIIGLTVSITEIPALGLLERSAHSATWAWRNSSPRLSTSRGAGWPRMASFFRYSYKEASVLAWDPTAECRLARRPLRRISCDTFRRLWRPAYDAFVAGLRNCEPPGQ